MPGEAALIGAGLNLATGLVQTMQANKAKKAADASAPEYTDPMQSSYLAELSQKRKSIDTGAAFANGMRTAEATGAGTMDAIVKSAGGDTGNTIQGLLQAQRGTDIAKNNVLATGQQQELGYNNLYSHMLDQISGRKLQLQLARQAQNMAQYGALKSSANQNLMTGVAGALGSPQVLSSLQSKNGGSPPSGGSPAVSGSPAVTEGVAETAAPDAAGMAIGGGTGAAGGAAGMDLASLAMLAL